MADVIGQSFLVNLYHIPLARFFKRFSSYRTLNGKLIPLTVIYGTPQSAFRKIWARENGKMRLPVLNLHAASNRRLFNREPITGGYNIPVVASWDHTRKSMLVTKPPMQYEITYNVNLFTTNYKERDHIWYQIYSCFSQGDLHLTYYPDNSDRSNYIHYPIRLLEDFNDETDIEGLDLSENRDIIRSSFAINGQATVPFPAFERKYVENITVAETGHYDLPDTPTEDDVRFIKYGNTATAIDEEFCLEILDGNPDGRGTITP